jgi:dihydroorotate dehydrogenase (fumarate)
MDLFTRYMGLELKNPIVASASPISGTVGAIRRLEDAGAAAVVLFSLFEEQVAAATEAAEGDERPGPDAVPAGRMGPVEYLELVRRAREAVEIPIFASLNGVTDRGWTDIASEMQQAGASGIELNVYYIPTEMYRTGRHVEEQYLDVLRAVRTSVTIPLAMKIGPYFSSMANMAGEFDRSGANALVLFNRFYQPDVDIESRRIIPSVELSRPDEIRLPLMWIAILYGRLRASLAATTGVHGLNEVIKYLMAGADVVMTTSALLREGPVFVERVLAQLGAWMERKGLSSVAQLRGCLSHEASADPTAFVRANYIQSLGSREPGEPWHS